MPVACYVFQLYARVEAFSPTRGKVDKLTDKTIAKMARFVNTLYNLQVSFCTVDGERYMTNPPNRGRTPQQAAQLAKMRGDHLREQIEHWLEALEKFRRLRDAPRRNFTTTGCSRGGGDHNWHVRLVPRPPLRSNYLACTAPRAWLSPADLMRYVITPLRAAGFAVSQTAANNCGCVTFTVLPKRLAE